MIHVAYVVHTFGTAGVERSVARLVNHLDRERFRPLIICLGRNLNASQWVKSHPVFELRKADRNDPRMILRLARLLRRNRVDLVHSHNWGTLVETVVARCLSRVRHHVHAERGTVMAVLDPEEIRGRLKSRVMRWALGRPDAVVAVAESVQKRLVDWVGISSDRVQVIPNGVDTPTVDDPSVQRNTIRQRLGLGSNATLIGSVGRLESVKNFASAISALHLLVQREIDAHLLLVGDGSERSTLCEQARSLGVDARVHLVGQQMDVGAWLAAMDIYVNCSLSEGISQSVLEAMAVGQPLVVTDVGDHAGVVGGEHPCGLVIPTDQPAALAEALSSLIGDETQRTTLSREALRRHQTNYDIQSMVRTYEDLYSKLCFNR